MTEGDSIGLVSFGGHSVIRFRCMSSEEDVRPLGIGARGVIVGSTDYRSSARADADLYRTIAASSGLAQPQVHDA